MANEPGEDILVGTCGEVSFVFTDRLAAVFAGEPQRTVRASHVESAAEYGVDGDGWVAYMRPSSGPILLGPGGQGFPTRAAALAAERRWLREECEL